MKEIFVIADPNGAGKTTTAFTLLPEFIRVNEYVNADSLAHALSPFDPDAVAIQAGKLMLRRIHELAEQNKSFAFETTLASKSFVQFLQNCKRNDYKINLVFLWLHSVELAIERVKLRVSQGGHSIPIVTIRRRYERGLQNFFNLYIPLADKWVLYNNSDASPIVICSKIVNNPLEISTQEIWEKLHHLYLKKPII